MSLLMRFSYKKARHLMLAWRFEMKEGDGAFLLPFHPAALWSGHMRSGVAERGIGVGIKHMLPKRCSSQCIVMVDSFVLWWLL